MAVCTPGPAIPGRRHPASGQASPRRGSQAGRLHRASHFVCSCAAKAWIYRPVAANSLSRPTRAAEVGPAGRPGTAWDSPHITSPWSVGRRIAGRTTLERVARHRNGEHLYRATLPRSCAERNSYRHFGEDMSLVMVVMRKQPQDDGLHSLVENRKRLLGTQVQAALHRYFGVCNVHLSQRLYKNIVS